MARRWIRLWVNEILHSTVIWDLTDAEFSVFIKLLVLAGTCRSDGLISAGPGKPFPDDWITTTLNIPPALFEEAKQKLIETERINVNGDGIKITKWEEYQSEYDRQKPYRQAKKQGAVIHKVCESCGYKEKTSEDTCPKCRGDMVRDYQGGKYGHMVKR